MSSDQLQGVNHPVRVGGPADWQKREYTAADKSELFARFKETQKRLTQLLEEQDDALLKRPVLGKSYTFEKLLIGIAQHDIYHLGQIYLLKTACQHPH